MNIFGVGLPEMMLILGIALLIFGPKKLPEIGRSLGQAIRGFQEAADEFQTEFKREADQLENSVKMNAQLESQNKETQTPPAESASSPSQDASKA
ncbi:TatA/E family twin arginine-targeting protein translocase [Spirulina sp. CS-785/01]|uniref:TatA/E family twin arginine-targeting protein translocase n=1 Tax=Spirulina sp. CS-785/01 TaxID=3021716 RepID=UPI002330CD31|nr:TatA/E family twin arginine-targeting protein translocase [Spirulina sp. CS-785/01]MDB9312386.1 TatA/E family twin arginine-targeting protein translocase [Spirulina sp. CS-785/01]